LGLKDQELVTSPPHGKGAGRQSAAEDGPDEGEDLVAAAVSVPVVDALEVVQAQQDRGA
jgi:hypothetical protein